MKIIKKYKIQLAVILALLLSFFLWFENNALVTTNYTYSSPNMPDSLDGMKIVQISDLHNKQFGKNNQKLIKRIQDLDPDIIVVTGDIIDGRRKGFTKTFEFADAVNGIAPVYYVTGNHEYRLSADEREWVLSYLEQDDFHVMSDSHETVEYNGAEFNILGINDPRPLESQLEDRKDLTYKQQCELVAADMKKRIDANTAPEMFNLLLSHRPNALQMYSETDADIVFSGHAHGGQIRLPFAGAIWLKNRGFFPQYTDGTWQKDSTTLVVSRGLGNSIFPFRVFNRPEVVCVTFEK